MPTLYIAKDVPRIMLMFSAKDSIYFLLLLVKAYKGILAVVSQQTLSIFYCCKIVQRLLQQRCIYLNRCNHLRGFKVPFFLLLLATIYQGILAVVSQQTLSTFFYCQVFHPQPNQRLIKSHVRTTPICGPHN